MNSDAQLPDHLARLGEALDHAVRSDLTTNRSAFRRLRHPRRVVAAIAATAIVVPAAAIATQLISTNQVAASLPQGTLALMGTHPSCTVVTANVEYHCVLAKAPSNDGAPQAPSSAGSSGTTYKLSHLADGTAVLKYDGKTVTVNAGSLAAVKRKLLAIKAATGTSAAPTNNTPSSTAADWTGTVEPTVDATKHVNGGCRAQNAAGTDWECYVGQAAVQQKIIGSGFLGQNAPAPGVG
jgi:hypothetical protein